MILSVTLNPSVDRAIFLEKLLLGDTNRVLRTETDAGGKGINVARVAVELGAEAICTGFAGGGTGEFVKHVLDREGVHYDFVSTAGETRMNFSVEDKSGAPPTTFNEPGQHISGGEYQLVQDKVAELAPRAAYLALGGSLPPAVPADAFCRLIALAPNSKSVVDADGESMRLALQCKPFMVKPNAREAERLLGVSIRSRGGAIGAARSLRSMGIEISIVSMGEDGAVMTSSEGDFDAVAPKVKAVSSIGSGDSLIGGFLYGLERGMNHEECLRWGVAAGAATATTNGAEICRRPMVEELFQRVVVKRVS